MKALYTILLLGLFIWGYSLCQKHLCGNDAGVATTAAAASKTSDCNSSLTFKDGDNLKISSKENFRFALSDQTFETPSDNFLNTTINVIDYLAENKDRVMLIKGYYLENEENYSDDKTLGVARAKSIANYFVDNGVAQSQIQVSGKRTIESCIKDDILLKGAAISFTSKK